MACSVREKYTQMEESNTTIGNKVFQTAMEICHKRKVVCRYLEKLQPATNFHTPKKRFNIKLDFVREYLGPQKKQTTC